MFAEILNLNKWKFMNQPFRRLLVLTNFTKSNSSGTGSRRLLEQVVCNHESAINLEKESARTARATVMGDSTKKGRGC